MNTRLLMISSAVVMGLAGLALSFAPDEVLKALHIAPDMVANLLLQLLGALYLGFAILNWMAKGALIGGIFAKPISMGNGIHFFAGAMAVIKAASKTTVTPLLWVVLVVYALYAACFLYVGFTAPGAPPNPPRKGGL
jgi:Fe2+ transport system protein B